MPAYLNALLMRAKVLASLRPHLTSLLTLEGLLLAVSSQCTAITPLGASCTATFTNSGSSGSRGMPYREISSGMRLFAQGRSREGLHHIVQRCCRVRPSYNPLNRLTANWIPSYSSEHPLAELTSDHVQSGEVLCLPV